MKVFNRFHLHPYLIGIFPVISLYAHNQSQLQPGAPWRSLAVAMAATTVILLVLRLCFREWHTAAFVTSYIVLAFFIYNPLRGMAHNLHLANFNLGWNRYFLPIWVLLLISGIWTIVKKMPRGESTIQLFNLVAFTAVLLPFAASVFYSVSHVPSKYSAVETYASHTKQDMGRAVNQPDIYYIILDMYGRADKIAEEFKYDNTPFLDQLREQGFYVAACSTSNYSRTELSMASSFNMNYLPALGEAFTPGKPYFSFADTIIENNAVRQYLQKYGYSFVAFESGFNFVDISNADVYIKMDKLKGDIQAFELMLIDQTPAKMLVDKLASSDSQAGKAETLRIDGPAYDRTSFMLEQLPQVPSTISSPKFVYAHFQIPHPPYVFGPDGEYVGNDPQFTGGPNRTPVDDAAYRLGYSNQLRYINSLLPGLLKQIISRSKVPPIIIVQGDHGFWGSGPSWRMPILNAYYLPGKDASQLLYPSITPVNSFRIILNAYFNGHFEQLQDESYYTTNDQDFYNAERVSKKQLSCSPK